MGDWKYILINGKSKQLEIRNPVYDKETRQLTSIDDLRPFQKKDSEGNVVEPTPEIANAEKRKIYSEFFKKPFKDLLISSGAGSSIYVGGLSMWNLWKETESQYKTEDIDGFKIICDAVKFDQKKADLKALLSEIVSILNDRFGTEFEEADKLFFDQIEAELLEDEKLQTQAKANELDTFKYAFEDMFMNKLIGRMDQNQEIF